MSDRLPQLIADFKAAGFGHYLRGENDEVALLQGCYIDERFGLDVCEFFERFLHHSKGRWAGQPYLLSEHDRSILMPLYSWRRADGRRRFTQAQIWEPKKNGKSTRVAGFALYHAAGDGEGGAEVYLLANSREQATNVFQPAAEMVMASPSLNRQAKILDSWKKITFKDGSIVQALAADHARAEGKNASFWAFDEIHAANERVRKLREAFRFAGAAREQPMEIVISTAGDEFGPGRDEYEYAKAVQRGKAAGGIAATNVFVSICEADPTDDWTDPAVHRKANPHYGITINADDMAAECEKAKQSPQLAASFKRYRLNIWTGSETPWLNGDKWKSYGQTLDDAELRSLPCFGGLDLSSTTDLSAWVLVWKQPDGAIVIRPHFWLPADNIAERENEDRTPYRQFAAEGWMTLTEGNEIDYRYVGDRIGADWEKWGIKRIAMDPHMTSMLVQYIKTEFRIPDVDPGRLGSRGMLIVPQKTTYLGDASKTLESAVNRTGKIIHDGNPIAARHVVSCRAYSDMEGQVKPIKCDKARRRMRIDFVAATVNAVSQLLLFVERKGGLTFEKII